MFLSSKEARTRLGVSRDTIEKLIKSGDLKAIKIGNGRTGHYRISEDELQDYIERQAVKVATA